MKVCKIICEGCGQIEEECTCNVPTKTWEKQISDLRAEVDAANSEICKLALEIEELRTRLESQDIERSVQKGNTYQSDQSVTAFGPFRRVQSLEEVFEELEILDVLKTHQAQHAKAIDEAEMDKSSMPIFKRVPDANCPKCIYEAFKNRTLGGLK